MKNNEKLLFQVLDALENLEETPEQEKLTELTKAYAAALSLTTGITFEENDIHDVVREAKTKFDIRMGLGTIFKAIDYEPWLIKRQGAIEWFFWQRYKKQLGKKGFPPHVIRTLDKVTDKILDHAEDPKKEGKWARKGMVVGHVQSGKTANYIGLISKAADSGYMVIIVLAGLLNSLRSQTQNRIDQDFIGISTRTGKPTGVARFGMERKPISFTTTEKDFHKQTANTIQMGLSSIKEPVVFVLKKNKSTLDNLHKWLSGQSKQEIMDAPMLLIDDEADHASVNTNASDKSPTAINYAIRNLLSLFPKSSYIGYTATPFANIFIDPESEGDMQNGEKYRDLFPRDFILSLDPPDNYVGPDRIFGQDHDNFLRSVDDVEDLLPVRHKIDFNLDELPPSLIASIHSFIIAKAIRLTRGQMDENHSMMINASRFNRIQELLNSLVREQILEIKQAVTNFSSLPKSDALKNTVLKELNHIWDSDFSACEPSWEKVQQKLKDACDPIEIITINSKSTDSLDFSEEQYPQGRSIIAIGGLGLSRGLTLEGLTVSYFLRNSMMYDTLLQMGRWFGYRDGYADLCRIFLTEEASSWYQHITESTNELRSDFKEMERARLTTIDFELKIRSHPTALIVTARNKMKTAKDVPVEIALAGRLVEASVLLGDENSLKHNWKTLSDVISDSNKIKKPETDNGLGYLWKSLPSSIVRQAVQSFHNHPECMLTDHRPLLQYIDWLDEQGNTKFDILLRSNINEKHSITVDGLKVNCIRRRTAELNKNRIEFSKRRVAGVGDEKAGLTLEEIQYAEDGYKSKIVPDKAFRKVPGRNPLFMIFFAAISKKDEENKKDDAVDKTVATFGISFPGDSGGRRKAEKLVQYSVNTIWWAKNMIIEEDDELLDQ